MKENNVFPQEIKKEGLLYVTILSFYELGDKIFGAIYIAFMRLRGATIANISLLFSIEQLLMAVLDLPAGAISDKFGRKKIASLGFIVWGTSIILFCIGHGFWTFLPGIALFAVGLALIAGAPTSWFIDQLIKKGAYEKRGQIIPKAQTIIRLFSIIAALISFVLVNYSNELTILVAGGLVIIAGVIGLTIGEDNFGNVKAKTHKIVQNSIKNFVKSKCLLIMAFKTIIGYISFITFILYWQIYATEYVNIGTKYLSAILVVFMVALMLGNYLTSLLLKKSPAFIAVVIGYLICLMGYILLIVNLHNSIITFLVGGFVIEFGFGTEQASTIVWLNNYFDSNVRSTYNSVFSTIECIFGFLIINILGIIAQKFGLKTIWALSIGSIIVTVLVMIYLNKLNTSERINDPCSNKQ